jgi:hypothetical protein
MKIGDPITVVLLAPDPYELIDARLTYRDDYALNPRWEWQTVGLTEQRVGTVYDRKENVDWARGHGDDVRAVLLLARSV